MTSHRVRDINEGRRCKRCQRRLVKREDPTPVQSWTWNIDGKAVSNGVIAPNSMVMWVCAVCDLGESA